MSDLCNECGRPLQEWEDDLCEDCLSLQYDDIPDDYDNVGGHDDIPYRDHQTDAPKTDWLDGRNNYISHFSG